MMTSPKLMVAIGLILIGAWSIPLASRVLANRPGALKPEQATLEWRSPKRDADRTQSALETRYTLENTGDRPVSILSVTTGCGCTVAGFEPKIVVPGRKAVVTVTVQDFLVGEKTVPITVVTDSPAEPEVRASNRTP